MRNCIYQRNKSGRVPIKSLVTNQAGAAIFQKRWGGEGRWVWRERERRWGERDGDREMERERKKRAGGRERKGERFGLF